MSSKSGDKSQYPCSDHRRDNHSDEDVEHEVARAADDLHHVNIELAKEVDERIVIESELADMKTDLAKCATIYQNPDQRGETRNIYFQDALTGLPNRVYLKSISTRGWSRQNGAVGDSRSCLLTSTIQEHYDSYGHDLETRCCSWWQTV